MGFQINRYWNRLSSVLGVPLDERIRHERLAVVDKDYHTALESCIDYWITNESNSSMEKLLEAARAVENESEICVTYITSHSVVQFFKRVINEVIFKLLHKYGIIGIRYRTSNHRV